MGISRSKEGLKQDFILLRFINNGEDIFTLKIKDPPPPGMEIKCQILLLHKYLLISKQL
jgi:hypothetical protein